MGHSTARVLALAGSATLIAGLIAPTLATAAPVPASVPTTTSAAAVARDVSTTALPIARIDVKSLATQAFAVAKKLYACENLAEKGLECLKEPTIKDVLKKLDEIEKQIAANQAQTMKALDSLQKAVDAQDLVNAVDRLTPIEAHILEAGKGWEAMSNCADRAVAKAATCTAYNGANKPNEPVARGMQVSRAFFLAQMDKIGISIERATKYFSGTQAISGTDGLLHNLWKSAKREQDRNSGATSAGQLPLTPVVVTRALSLDFLPTMTYYRDLVYLFGALHPAAKELRQQSTQAEAEANLADKNIFAATNRWTVAGGFDFYRIPDVPVGTIAYVGTDGKLYKIVRGQSRGVSLRREVVQELGDRIAKYGYNADTMAKDPQLLPHRGEWTVLEKVLHRTYKEYSGKYAICASSAAARPCDTNLDGTLTETFEIGHPGAVGSVDSRGNRMIERWVPMRVLGKEAKWGTLVDQERKATYAACSLIGEPPYGVHKVRFLETFRRLVENKHADFTWDVVRYGYSNKINVTPNCVGPGIYVRPGGEPYSVVDKGTPPGILK